MNNIPLVQDDTWDQFEDAFEELISGDPIDENILLNILQQLSERQLWQHMRTSPEEHLCIPAEKKVIIYAP